MNYWLIKSEPFKYSWDQMVADKSTYWDGVKSYAARIFLKEITIVEKEHYQDPTTDDDRWVAVDVKVVKALNRTITLKELKADDFLKDMRFVKQSRLSVAPVTQEEFDRIMTLTETTL